MSDSEPEPFSEPPPGGAEDLDFQLAAQPHDAYFKQVFSDPVQAAGFFRSRLPTAVSAAIRWEELTVVRSSFVKGTLQQAHSDLLFSVPAGEQKLLLYLLFEHQTSVDRAMPLRLLVYMAEIWLDHERREGLPVPAVIPFVLHQGPEAWNVPVQFAEIVAVPDELAPWIRPFVPAFEHGLLDLSRYDPATEESDQTLRVVLQLMKLVRERDRIGDFWEWLAGEPNPLSEGQLLLSILYTYHADGRLDVEEIARRLRHNPELRNRAMTTAEKLIAKGREEGLLKGEWIGQIRILQQMMSLPLTAKSELESSSPAELEKRFAELQKEYDARFKNR